MVHDGPSYGSVPATAVAAVSLVAGGSSPAVADQSFARGNGLAANPRVAVQDNVRPAGTGNKGKLPNSYVESGIFRPGTRFGAPS